MGGKNNIHEGGDFGEGRVRGSRNKKKNILPLQVGYRKYKIIFIVILPRPRSRELKNMFQNKIIYTYYQAQINSKGPMMKP